VRATVRRRRANGPHAKRRGGSGIRAVRAEHAQFARSAVQPFEAQPQESKQYGQ